MKNTVPGRGSRFSGAALSIDSRITEKTPNREFNGQTYHVTPEKLHFPLSTIFDDVGTGVNLDSSSSKSDEL